MAPTLENYINKYKVFTGLEEPEYSAAVENSVPELALVRWGDLAHRAEEMLIGHLLIVANPQKWQQARVFQKVAVNDRGYETVSSNVNGNDNTFYREYQRLLGLVKGNSSDGVSTNLEQNMTYLVQRPSILTESF